MDCASDSDGFAVGELDGISEDEAAIDDVTTLDGCPVEDTVCDSSGVMLAATETELTILGEAVILSVDEADGLISGVFVSVCKGDGDAVE